MCLIVAPHAWSPRNFPHSEEEAKCPRRHFHCTLTENGEPMSQTQKTPKRFLQPSGRPCLLEWNLTG